MKHENVPHSYKQHEKSIMSNFDHEIDEKVIEILKREKKCSAYPGMNFYGLVWWNRKRKKWACMIERYQQHVNTFYANSPEKLMQKISDEYGYT